MNHEDFIKKLDGIIGKPKQKRDKDFITEFHKRHRILIRYVCNVTNCPSTITGKILFANCEEALRLKIKKIYCAEAVVEILEQKIIYDSNRD